MKVCEYCGKSFHEEKVAFCKNCGNPTWGNWSEPVRATPSVADIEGDIWQNPERYQERSFPYSHRCGNGHLIPPFTPIPVAGSNRYCPYCSQRISIA